MQKFSDTTLAKLGKLSPDELVAHGVIQPARVSGYICPICGSGDGKNGTGMKHNEKIETHTSFTCFSGKHSFNVLKLCALHYNLDTRNDYKTLVEKICADFGIEIEYDEFTLTGGKRTAKKKKRRRETISPDELKNIQADLNASPESLKTFVNCQSDKKWRGFDIDFLLAHGCRLINDWTPPKTRGTNKEFATKTMRMIIPNGDAAYLARLVDSPKNYGKAGGLIEEKLHAGHKKLFLSNNLREDLQNTDEPVFAVEGYIDCMSIELAGFKAVALGGRGEGELLVETVDNIKHCPQIIILFDNDNAGRESAPELREDLLTAKCPCVVHWLSKPQDKSDVNIDCMSGSAVMTTPEKIDANQILQKYGVDVLRGILQDIIDNSLAELNAVESELGKKDSAGLSDEDWDFIFSGDSSDLDYAYRFERFFGSKVRWLKDAEQWLIYEDGKWLHYSEKNSAVTPFVRKLAETMKQNAADKDERELAEKLKSSKKIGAAITLLKSCDSILIRSADLDKHPNLLNCQNGVVDLETGERMDTDPTLYLTQQISVDYDARADSTFIENFFAQIQPDEMTRRGLLRWLGYNLCGSVREEKFLIWLGESGANGKGVLSRTLSALLRDYAAALPRGALVLRKFDDGNSHTAALNALIGARFAISEELPQNIALDSSLIKTFTGGDLQNLRRMREEFKDYEPTAKINMSSNFVPKFENVDDGGIERRILVMPFTETFRGNRADPRLKEKLLAPENLRGLLKILVDEAVAWNKDGLIISDAMTKATRDNLYANDFVSDFLEEFCDVGNGKGEMPRRVLLDKLYEKCPQARQHSDRDLCKMIEKRGVLYMRSMHGFVFRGIRFLTDDDWSGEPVAPDEVPFDD